MMKTLLVEDDEILLKSLSYFLKSQGYNVIGFDNGLDAIEYVKTSVNEIEIIITDLNLPFAGGQLLIRTVRQTSEDIPIIVLTSSGVESTELEVYDLGANEFISKPFSPAILLKRMERLLVNQS